MRAGGIDWEWLHPLEKFLAPERRLLSLLLLVSIALHGAALVALRAGWGERRQAVGVAPEVFVLPSGSMAAGEGGSGEAIGFDLRFGDPSAIALPRLVPLAGRQVVPPVLVPAPPPARAESLAVSRDSLPAAAASTEALAGQLLALRPTPVRPAAEMPDAAPVAGAVTFGTALASRLADPPPALDPVVRDRPLDGPTVLNLAVDADGCVRGVLVASSSGAVELDARALEAGWRMRFRPAAGAGVVWSAAAFHWPEAPERAGRESAP